MDVFEAVRTLLAVRGYQDRPVPDTVVRRIVEAGRLTRSGMDGQPWHLIVVRAPGTLRNLRASASAGPYGAQAPPGLCVGALTPRRALSGASGTAQLSPPSAPPTPSPPPVAENMRLGCRWSNASAIIVVFGSTSIFTRAQLAPPSLRRNSAPRSLWKFAPAATQIVFG